MKASVAVVFAFLVAATTAHPVALPSYHRQGACFTGCEFYFCDGATSFALGKPDVSITTAICKDDIIVGHIDATGEALVSEGNGFTPISAFDPAPRNGVELLQSFPSSFFKSFTTFCFECGNVEKSGIGHETPQRNQIDYLDGLCVVVPIWAYQRLDNDGLVLENFAPREDEACVAFSVTVDGDSGPAPTAGPAPTDGPSPATDAPSATDGPDGPSGSGGGAIGLTVTVTNTFEDSQITSGVQTLFGTQESAVIDSDEIEFPDFIGFYSIDFLANGFTMTLFDNSQATDLVLPEGRFDRYYFALGSDEYEFTEASLTNGPALNEHAIINVLPPGYELEVEDQFETGIEVPTFPYGGLMMQFGPGTDLSELGAKAECEFSVAKK
eukprot:CAMPEP_0198336492 /NCGR_PEP_ID=MMETSP1450-20131203/21019_1 /TAXON_ID=753684 ORGANISM="Madagascaria erythrocladiodes, Strain CCMP3234" /NCGR_SAMPLE_ID=MMETSP1450 /ASSEMBLY_ACC=CAM_ASM_001115 /LENGTH=382 /DNA_ID=CAMNT_0044041231 /DNA_START=178 /DNA_END=1326 /DNA_ORIENTATION=+